MKTDRAVLAISLFLFLLIGHSFARHQDKSELSGGRKLNTSGHNHNRHRNVHEVGQEDGGSQQQGDSTASLGSETQNSVEQTQNYEVASMWHSAESESKAKVETLKSQSTNTNTQKGSEFAEDHVTAWHSIPKDPFTWDGEASWEYDNPRTLYFEPTAGLGNRLRALASAIVLAKEYGVGLKVIWRPESPSYLNGGFNSTWKDLFSEPSLRLADNFPGSNWTVDDEMNHYRAEGRADWEPPIYDHECGIYNPHSHQDMVRIMETGWKKVNGHDTLCVRADVWLTEAGEKEGKFFFRLLKPSPMVQSLIDKFKYETEWEENHMVGVHVRRGDLTIWGKNNQHTDVKSLIPLSNYIDTMKAQKHLAAGIRRVRFFLATDDAQAEAEIKAAFKPGYVFTYPKIQYDRTSVEGIQEALVDVMLLADCPVLVGTYYSSYSETAKMMGWPFYIQVGHDLKRLSVETVFEKDDPEEEDENGVLKRLF